MAFTELSRPGPGGFALGPRNPRPVPVASLSGLVALAALVAAPAAHAQLTRATYGNADLWIGSSLYVHDTSFSDQAAPLDKFVANGAASGGTHGSASSHVQAGLLHALASAQASSSGHRQNGEQYLATAGANGSFLDSLTTVGQLLGGGVAVGNGFLYGSIAVNGTLSAPASAGTSVHADLSFVLAVPGSIPQRYVSDWSGKSVFYRLMDGQLRRMEYDYLHGVSYKNVAGTFLHASSGSEVINDVVNVRIPLVFGAPSDFSFSAGVGASASIADPGVAASGTAIADFSHTFRWLGTSRVTRVDARGIERPLDSFSIASTSGTDYLLPVPEPSQTSLLAAGLAALLWLGRRRSPSADARSTVPRASLRRRPLENPS